MIMLRSILKLEDDGYLRIKAFDAMRRKVFGRIEDQSIDPGDQSNFFRNQVRDSSVGICRPFPNQFPAAGSFDFEGNRHAGRWPTNRSIQNVSSDGAHWSRSF